MAKRKIELMSTKALEALLADAADRDDWALIDRCVDVLDSRKRVNDNAARLAHSATGAI